MDEDCGKRTVNVLFMDDEIHDSDAATVNEAIQALKKSGYEVYITDKMSDAVEAFQQEYYDVFILDIDMHKIADIFQNRRGTMVADIFKSLDNDSAVIIYSAAATVEDLYIVANSHVSGYIYKNEDNAIEKLVRMTNKAALTADQNLILPQPRKHGTILIADTGLNSFSAEALNGMVSQAGDFHMQICPLDEMAERFSKSDNYAAGVILTEKISTRPGNIRHLDGIFSLQPFPNMIVGYPGKSNRDPVLFYLINARPFRLIDLLRERSDRNISKAIRQAALWYGGNETFLADRNYIQRASEQIDWDSLRKEVFPEDRYLF